MFVRATISIVQKLRPDIIDPRVCMQGHDNRRIVLEVKLASCFLPGPLRAVRRSRFPLSHLSAVLVPTVEALFSVCSGAHHDLEQDVACQLSDADYHRIRRHVCHAHSQGRERQGHRTHMSGCQICSTLALSCAGGLTAQREAAPRKLQAKCYRFLIMITRPVQSKRVHAKL
jgi:hypothetical protein